MCIVLVASIQGKQYYKLIVVVDGTFLQVAHGRTLITVCTKNVKEKTFPLTFAIVDSKNNLAY